MPQTKPATVPDYIDAAPKEARATLREIRAILKRRLPARPKRLSGAYQ